MAVQEGEVSAALMSVGRLATHGSSEAVRTVIQNSRHTIRNKGAFGRAVDLGERHNRKPNIAAREVKHGIVRRTGSRTAPWAAASRVALDSESDAVLSMVPKRRIVGGDRIVITVR